MTQPPPPPQWYPDPEQPGTLRYWDGRSWTDQRAPMQQPVQAQQVSSTVEVVGLLGAVFLPIVGFVMGIALINRSGAATAMIIISILSFLFWFAMLSNNMI